jgi:hypothetical protein
MLCDLAPIPVINSTRALYSAAEWGLEKKKCECGAFWENSWKAEGEDESTGKKIVLRNATDRARKTGISHHRSRTEIESSTLTPELFRIQVFDLNSAILLSLFCFSFDIYFIFFFWFPTTTPSSTGVPVPWRPNPPRTECYAI